MVYWGTGSDAKNYILAAESTIDDPNNWEPWGRPLIGPQEDTEYNCIGPGFPLRDVAVVRLRGASCSLRWLPRLWFRKYVAF